MAILSIVSKVVPVCLALNLFFTYRLNSVLILMGMLVSSATSVPAWGQSVETRRERPDKQIKVDSPLTEKETWIRFLKFSPDSKHLIAGDGIGNVFLIAVEEEKQMSIFQPNPNYDVSDFENSNAWKVADATFAQKKVFVAWENGAIAKFRITKDKLLLEKQVIPASSDYANAVFSPDAKIVGVISAVVDNDFKPAVQFQLIDLIRSKLIASASFPGELQAITCNESGSEYAVAVQGRIYFVDKRGRKSRPTIDAKNGIASMCYDHSGKLLIVGLHGETPRLSQYKFEKNGTPKPTTKLIEKALGSIGAIIRSSNKNHILVDSFTTTICDIDSLDTEDAFSIEKFNIRSAAFSPDKQWLALGGDGKSIDFVKLRIENESEKPARVEKRKSRKWTSSNGKFSVNATLEKIGKDSVDLRKSDGQVISVPLISLSGRDLKYIEIQRNDR